MRKRKENRGKKEREKESKKQRKKQRKRLHIGKRAVKFRILMFGQHGEKKMLYSYVKPSKSLIICLYWLDHLRGK